MNKPAYEPAIKLSEEQRELFKKLYKFIHDERMNCSNLAGMIAIVFPDPGENAVSIALHTAVKPCLEMRAGVGGETMQIMYLLEEMVRSKE